MIALKNLHPIVVIGYLVVGVTFAVAYQAISREVTPSLMKDESKLAASVNGVGIPKIIVEMESGRVSGVSPEKAREDQLKSLIDAELMAQEAERVKEVASSDAVVAGIDQQKRNILAMAYARHIAMTKTPSSQEIEAEAGKLKAELGSEQYLLQEFVFPVAAHDEIVNLVRKLNLSDGAGKTDIKSAIKRLNGGIRESAWVAQNKLSTTSKAAIAEMNGNRGFFVSNPKNGTAISLVAIWERKPIVVDVSIDHDLLVGRVRYAAVQAEIDRLRAQSSIEVLK